MQQSPIRRRPKLQTTVADETYKTLDQMRQDVGLSTLGVTIDYMVKDHQRISRLLHASSLDTTQKYIEAQVALP